MVQSYHLSETLLLGSGCREELPERLRSLSGGRALVVTDPQIRELGIPEDIGERLQQVDISVSLFDEVSPDPTTKQVSAALTQFLQEDCTLIVAVGGGSSIDCAKAVNLVAEASEFVEPDPGDFAGLPLVAVPTTAGTGSEVTEYSVITDAQTHEKQVLRDPTMIPQVAVCDAEITRTLPPDVTANTGLDALTHAIEAYLCTRSAAFSDALAEKAIEAICQYLPRAYANGKDDMEAREEMMEAQMLAGMAFSNSGLGLVHSTSHALGSTVDEAHGRCNAVMLPHVLAFNLNVCAEELARLLPLVGQPMPGRSDLQQARQVGAVLWDLLGSLEIPRSVEDLGVARDDLPDLAERAVSDPTLKTNPVQPTVEEIQSVYERAFEGANPFK